MKGGGIGRWCAAIALAGSCACNKEWNAEAGRASLRSQGYGVSALTPAPVPPSAAGVQKSECFDASKGSQKAHVCVWTCESAGACIHLPAQTPWHPFGTVGRCNAYVDAKDESFANAVLTDLHR
jgi:hypothetical protein